MKDIKSNKKDIEQQIQKLRNEKMKLIKKAQKEAAEMYNKKYRQKVEIINNEINELQKKEADQA